MRIHEQLSHWNNFTVPELKDILEHCVALERLGIAQDDEMMASIERDIALREKEVGGHYAYHISKHEKIKRPTTRTNANPAKQQPQGYLLEQTA